MERRKSRLKPNTAPAAPKGRSRELEPKKKGTKDISQLQRKEAMVVHQCSIEKYV